MAINGAFQPQGRTIVVTTNGTGSTASSQQISFNPVAASQSTAQATGLTFAPTCFRVVAAPANTAPVFMDVTQLTRVAVIPIAGTPSFQFIIPAADIEIFTVKDAPNPADYTMWVNTISTAVSQVLYIVFGEGM